MPKAQTNISIEIRNNSDRDKEGGNIESLYGIIHCFQEGQTF